MDDVEDAIIDNLGVVPVVDKSNTCFIPTFSALDLNINPFASFSLDDAPCFSNFDYIYANKDRNASHMTLDFGARDFILKHVFGNYPSIRTSGATNLNLEINSGLTVNSGSSYNEVVKEEIWNQSGFEVSAGGAGSLIAGQEIRFTPGVVIREGANFNLSIEESSDIVCDGPVIHQPHYVTSMLHPMTFKKAEEEDNVEYNCENITEAPFYEPGMEDAFCVNEGADTSLAQLVRVSPNPTRGPVRIEFLEPIDFNELDIRLTVFNPSGIPVLNNVKLMSNTYDFDISGGMIGVYTLEFNFDNGVYRNSLKILKN